MSDYVYPSTDDFVNTYQGFLEQFAGTMSREDDGEVDGAVDDGAASASASDPGTANAGQPAPTASVNQNDDSAGPRPISGPLTFLEMIDPEPTLTVTAISGPVSAASGPVAGVSVPPAFAPVSVATSDLPVAATTGALPPTAPGPSGASGLSAAPPASAAARARRSGGSIEVAGAKIITNSGTMRESVAECLTCHVTSKAEQFLRHTTTHARRCEFNGCGNPGPYGRPMEFFQHFIRDHAGGQTRCTWPNCARPLEKAPGQHLDTLQHHVLKHMLERAAE